MMWRLSASSARRWSWLGVVTSACSRVSGIGFSVVAIGTAASRQKKSPGSAPGFGLHCRDGSAVVWKFSSETGARGPRSPCYNNTRTGKWLNPSTYRYVSIQARQVKRNRDCTWLPSLGLHRPRRPVDDGRRGRHGALLLRQPGEETIEQPSVEHDHAGEDEVGGTA